MLATYNNYSFGLHRKHDKEIDKVIKYTEEMFGFCVSFANLLVVRLAPMTLLIDNDDVI